MYGYIYLTENLINGKKYIGQHRHETFDTKYYGSGVLLCKAIEKYGKENFKVSILYECFSEEELNDKEREFIKQHDAVNSSEYYNVADGGSNANNLAGKSSEEIAEIVSRWRTSMDNRSEEDKTNSYNKLINTLNNRSEEEKQHTLMLMRNATLRALQNRSEEEKQRIIQKSLATRNNRTPEEKQITSQKHTNSNNKMWAEMTPQKLEKRTLKYKETRAKQTEERKTEISENARNKTIEQMSNMTEEQLRARSEKVTATWNSKSEEEKKKYSEECRKRSLGKIWVTNGEYECIISPNLFEEYKLKGYIKGRKKSYLKTIQELSNVES